MKKILLLMMMVMGLVVFSACKNLNKPTEDLLFSWDGGDKVLEFYINNAYWFEDTEHNIYEKGTFSYVDSTLTITQSNNNMITATLDQITREFSLVYVSVKDNNVTNVFTVDVSPGGYIVLTEG